MRAADDPGGPDFVVTAEVDVTVDGPQRALGLLVLALPGTELADELRVNGLSIEFEHDADGSAYARWSSA